MKAFFQPRTGPTLALGLVSAASTFALFLTSIPVFAAPPTRGSPPSSSAPPGAGVEMSGHAAKLDRGTRDYLTEELADFERRPRGERVSNGIREAPP